MPPSAHASWAEGLEFVLGTAFSEPTDTNGARVRARTVRELGARACNRLATTDERRLCEWHGFAQPDPGEPRAALRRFVATAEGRPMAHIDAAKRLIQTKVVYWGPRGSGKTSCLRHMWRRAQPNVVPRGEARHDPASETFDYLPMALGEIRGFATRFDLYSVPGAHPLERQRCALLEGVDGIVFVAAGGRATHMDDVRSLSELESALRGYDRGLDSVPWVLQLNMRDLPDALPRSELLVTLGRHSPPCVESVATTGEGVFEALKAICRLVLLQLKH